jgi:large conductance mechanosensitive channel
MGGVDFKQLYINLGSTAYDTMELAEKAGAPLIKYGVFINSMVDFLIIAFAIFVAVKAINSLKRKEEAAPAAPAPTPEDVVLLREIRDALKK